MMVKYHSRKGIKKAEEILAFLTRNAGLSKEKVVLETLRRFKLNYTDANKIYMDWRKKYVTGQIADKEENIVGNLKLYAKHYAKTNKKGLEEKEIINLVNSINKNGITGTARKFKMDRIDVYTVYCNAKGFGLIDIAPNHRRGKYARK